MNTIRSKDGTIIAYDKTGNGPAIILVDGAFCSMEFGPMEKIGALLGRSFTVFRYDRRGRGASGDTRPYSVDREVEDLETLIQVAGGWAYLFGISSGAMLCLEAVASGANVPKLALFEPPYVKDYRSASIGNFLTPLKNIIQSKNNALAVNFYLRKVMGAPAILPLILRLTPNWKKMKANAPSLINDGTLAGDFSMPLKSISLVRKPALVISSINSPKMLKQSARKLANLLECGRHISIKGSVHNAPPKVLVPVLIDFFSES